jgi:predicted enzyme related to lactoylglutathione lyase
VIKGLQFASVWSEDLNNLLPFYRDTLGLNVSMESPGFVILGDLNGVSLGLGTHSEVRGKASEPARHMIGLQTDDIQGDAKRLKDAGVEFIEEPNEFPEGWIATLKDPEGNYVQLFQNK